ncbi:MAG: hypothetical protein MJ176_09795 [Treponema sp.]|nr:hypothetical protein [Treponema sp.]
MKKKITLIIGFSLLFILLYLVFAGKPLNKEYHFNPEWKINVSNPTIQKASPGDKIIPFRLGKNSGYFTPEGKIVTYKMAPDKASFSDNYFAVYDSNATQVQFYSNDGTEQGILQSDGYPYFCEDNIFVMLPGGSSFSKCDETGMPQWTWYGSIPLTTFAVKKDFTAAGFIDGSIKLFDNRTGEVILEFSPGGSDYPCIYGLDITDDGQYIACLCGQDRQRFVLAKRENIQTKILFHTFISDETKTRSFVYWTKNQDKVLYNTKNNVGIYDMKDGSHTVIKCQSHIIDVAETDSLLFLLEKSQNNYSVDVIEKTNTHTGHFDFTANNAFIKTYDNALFLGRDANISKIQVSRK